MKPKLNLRSKLTLLIGGLVAFVLVGGFATILALSAPAQLREQVRVSGDRAQVAMAQLVSNRLKHMELFISLLADRPGTRGIWQADWATISDHLRDQLGRVDAEILVMADDRGVVQGSTSPEFKPGQNLGLDFGLTASGMDHPWSGIAMPDRPGLAVRIPMKVGDYVQAHLIGVVPLNQTYVAQAKRATGLEMTLLSNGHVLASTLPDGQTFQPFASGTEARVGGEVYLGREGAFDKAIPTVRYLALEKKSALMQPYISIAKRIGVLTLFGLVIAVGLASWLARALTRPLEQVITVAEQLTEGEWPQPMRTKRTDEIGLLQNVMDEMSASLQRSTERLMQMLHVDPLTELMNHRRFRQELDESLATEHDLSLVLIGLDNFGDMNERQGHNFGDSQLIQCAEILVKLGCTAARFGGDVFSILVPSDVAGKVAEDVRAEAQDILAGTVSIGVARLEDANGQTGLWILAAESALKQAKLAGRNRVRVFENFGDQDAEGLAQFLGDSNYASIRALAEAVDAKDEYTRGHSTRVAQYASELARALGMDEGFVNLVYMSGTLHDVGKIGVPDSVLKKAGHLTDEEFDEIKKHPALGEKIVSQIPQLRDTLPGIRSHHERFDGRGYPDRLAGEAIPILGRILAVADTFDAMTSDRPYRKGLDWGYSLQEIQKGAGTQFDPECAEAFVRLFQEKLAA